VGEGKTWGGPFAGGKKVDAFLPEKRKGRGEKGSCRNWKNGVGKEKGRGEKGTGPLFWSQGEKGGR